MVEGKMYPAMGQHHYEESVDKQGESLVTIIKHNVEEYHNMTLQVLCSN